MFQQFNECFLWRAFFFSGRSESITVLGINFWDPSILRGCNVAQWQSFLYWDYIFPKERMTDDAEISPLVENRGQHLKLLFCRARTGAPPHCLDNRLHILTCWGKKHISDSQHSGNMFIVFVAMKKKRKEKKRKTHAQLKQMNISVLKQIKSIKCEMFWP